MFRGDSKVRRCPCSPDMPPSSTLLARSSAVPSETSPSVSLSQREREDAFQATLPASENPGWASSADVRPPSPGGGLGGRWERETEGEVSEGRTSRITLYQSFTRPQRCLPGARLPEYR